MRSDSEILSNALSLVKLLISKIQTLTETNAETGSLRSICNFIEEEINYLPQQIKDTYKSNLDYIRIISRSLPSSSAKEYDAREIESYLHTILPEIIYHYTSYESFYNILKTGQLHLSAPWNANDLLEGEYHHGGKGNGKKQRYFTSFSNKFDSRLIWEAYGDKGRGVAIGFRTNKLNDVLAFEEKKWEAIVKEKSIKDGEIQLGKRISSVGKILNEFADINSLNYNSASMG